MELPRLRRTNTKNTVAPQTRSEEPLLKRLEELEVANAQLRRKVWRLEYRSPFSVGIGLAGGGAALLLLSYIYSLSILTFIGLGLILWGSILLYSFQFRHVPTRLMNSASLSTLRSLDTLLVGLGYKGKSIFLHPKGLKGLLRGYIFIPYNDDAKIPTDEDLAKERIFYEEPKGILMTAPSQGVVELMERELGVNFAMVDLQYIKENIPNLMISSLRLIDDLSIDDSDSIVKIKVRSMGAASLCSALLRDTKLGHDIGCPVCTSLAIVISKSIGRPVTIKESIVSNDTIKTSLLIVK